MKHNLIGLLLALFCFSANGLAQKIVPYNKAQALSINRYIRDYSQLPIQPARTFSYHTDEASRIHCDASPDGKYLVFTILGDLYLLPSAGGKAIQLTRGVSVNSVPTFSPDGRYIAFTSDASGSQHTHIRDLEGKFHVVLQDTLPGNPFQYRWPVDWEPSWISNMEVLLANNTIFHLNGQNRKKTMKSEKVLGYSKGFLYGADIIPGKGAVIKKIDMNTGNPVSEQNVSNRFTLGNMRISHNGDWVSFIEEETSTLLQPFPQQTLRVLNLQTGITRKLTSLSPADSIHQSPSFRYCFSPDDRFIYIGYDGKIHKIDIQTGANVIIPFFAEVNGDMGAVRMHRIPVDLKPKTISLIRNAQMSSNDGTIVFDALNKIYFRNGQTGQISAVSNNDTSVAHRAVFSPNGKYIAYIQQNRHSPENCIRVGLANTRSLQTVLYTHSSRIYSIAFSPDGNTIAAIENNPGSGEKSLITVSVQNGKRTVLHEKITAVDHTSLTYSKDGTQLFYTGTQSVDGSDYPRVILYAAEVKDNGKRRELAYFTSRHASDGRVVFTVSPDANYIYLTYNQDAYLYPIAISAKTVVLDQATLIRFAVGAFDMYCDKSGQVNWSFGNRFFSTTPAKILASVQNQSPVDDRFHVLPFKCIDAQLKKVQSTSVDLTYKVPHNDNTYALINANIITMEGRSVFFPGTMIISNGRIKDVGNSAEIKVSANVHVMDMAGKTIIPGLFDLHQHGNGSVTDVPDATADRTSFFAFGNTTAIDPSNSYDMFGYDDLFSSGAVIGPRMYTVGKSVGANYGSSPANFKEARNEVYKRTKLGAIAIKQYKLFSRIQQQWLLLASDEMKVNMTNEAADDYNEFIAQLKNGTPKIEHFTWPFYTGAKKDIIHFVAQSGTYFTSTSQMNTGANGYVRLHFADTSEKLKRFSYDEFKNFRNIKKEGIIDILSPYYTYVQQVMQKYRDAGLKIAMGSHGDTRGVGLFNQMWVDEIGGDTRWQILHSATLAGAEGLGMEKDLGSLKKGKIADFLILSKNPLTDLHFSDAIKFVVKNGIIYDGDTLEILRPDQLEKKMHLQIPIKRPR